LLILYIGSLLYFAARLGWSFYSTAMLLRGSYTPSLTPEQDELWHRCKRAFSIEAARILTSQRIPGPVTIGFRQPLLLVPVDFAEQCPSQDFLAAVAHECAHIKRRDFQKNLFYEFATLIIAFHPITWMLKSRIAQTREMICDGMATEILIDSRDYTQSLLRLATMIAMNSRISTSHAIGIFDANILEKRIMMINMRKRHFSSALKYGLTIPAALFLLFVAIGGAAMAFAIEPQSPSHAADEAKPYGHVYKIGKDVSAPVLIDSTDPVYPESARKTKDKFDGTCLIGLVVDASGVPQDVHVVRSLGPDFDASAIKAVQQYRFTPAMRSGEPVAVALHLEVNFKKY
jgi:TonB family protein